MDQQSVNGAGGRRDISQFVKYLLEGSGVEENSVDFAALRRELEQTVDPNNNTNNNNASGPLVFCILGDDFPRFGLN